MPSEASDTPLYNTAAVVQRTGVPATTFRAWERRYGYPKPRRDEGDRRLYSEHDIQAIRWLADQTTRGVAIGRAVELLRGGHGGPGTATVGHAPSEDGRSFEALRSALGQALLALDADRGDHVLSEAFALFSVEDVCLRVLQPLLVEVGDRWHAGELSVAEEHYVSSFVRGKLFSLLQAYQTPDSRGPLVLTACAPDEWHEVGILMVSIFLARRGCAVRYLGPNLPPEGLAAMVARHHPAVVALSAQSRESARKVRTVARVLQAGAPPRPRLVFGGQAFNADARLRTTLDGTYVGPDAAATVDAIAHIVDQATVGPPRRSRSARRRPG
jgi:MerR family transcriptional regulator, light-induced transcriptional regulator